MTEKTNVLFVCTGNSARSQMAEALMRHSLNGNKNKYAIYSAGTRPASRVNSYAIQVLKEQGIKTSGMKPKSCFDLGGVHFHYTFTLCDEDIEDCNVLSADTVNVRWTLPDPAKFSGSKQAKHWFFAHIRDGIDARINEFTHLIEQSDWVNYTQHDKEKLLTRIHEVRLEDETLQLGKSLVQKETGDLSITLSDLMIMNIENKFPFDGDAIAHNAAVLFALNTLYTGLLALVRLENPEPRDSVIQALEGLTEFELDEVVEEALQDLPSDMQAATASQVQLVRDLLNKDQGVIAEERVLYVLRYISYFLSNLDDREIPSEVLEIVNSD